MNLKADTRSSAPRLGEAGRAVNRRRVYCLTATVLTLLHLEQ